MRYIDWNIKCYCQIEKILELLEKHIIDKDCVVALQEVMPDKAEFIKQNLSENYQVIYSLDYYPSNAEFDTDNRRLGVMLIISNNISIIECGVFERCLFPERTLYATVMIGDRKRRIVNLHSITGVSFKMGKAVQYRRFAEVVNEYRPDILSMDANEPKVDHYDISKMEFFDQGDGGKGARLFFEELGRCGLEDIYAKRYDKSEYQAERPLIVSHIINNKIHRRYDFVFAKDVSDIHKIEYYYEEACEATSDHALIVADILLGTE